MLWTVGERHIWALGDAEVAPCPVFPSVKEVLIESLEVLPYSGPGYEADVKWL